MFSKIFIVVFFSIAIEAQNTEPYCKLFTGNSTMHYPKPYYQCLNQKSFPINLTNPGEIKTLYLWDDSNKLQVLKMGGLLASKATNLEALILVKCKIREIEKGAFRGGNKITRLDLSRNEIEKLDLNVFEDLPSLQRLWLNENPLTSVLYNSTFPHSSINVLNFGACKIRSINANIFENFVNLKELYLHGNLLTTLDWKIFRPLKKLRYLALEENPFHCDCQINFLLDYLKRRNIDWNRWKEKPSCSSSSFDHLIHLPLAARLSQQTIFVDWNSINRHHLVCQPQVSSLKRNKSPDNNISLECEYSGYPEPRIIWRIDGEILQIGNRNKHLIETKGTEASDEPEFNYEFIQTLFISNLPFSAQSLEGEVTCQASRSVFTSTESNAITVSFPNIQTTTVINTVTSELLETSSPVPIGAERVPTNPKSPVTIGMERVPPDLENSIQTTVFIIIGAVAGLAMILIVAIFVAIRCRKTIPFYQFLPQKDAAPPVKYDATGHVYESIEKSCGNQQDEDGYETPISLSIQHLPLPPLPQQHNPVYEANKTK